MIGCIRWGAGDGVDVGVGRSARLDPFGLRAHLHGRLLDRRGTHRLATYQRVVPIGVPQFGRGRDHVVQLCVRLHQR